MQGVTTLTSTLVHENFPIGGIKQFVSNRKNVNNKQHKSKDLFTSFALAFTFTEGNVATEDCEINFNYLPLWLTLFGKDIASKSGDYKFISY